MLKKDVINLAIQYAKIIRSNYQPDKIVLYGSYAKGTANEDSDIDIAVIYKKFNGDWLKTSSDLWRIAYEVSSLIEPIILESENDKSGFVSDVIKNGVVIS